MTQRQFNDHRGFVSVTEAARFLGISRGLAYKLAHQYLTTGHGLVCERFGNRILVPLAWLEQQAARGCLNEGGPPSTRLAW